MKTNFELVNAFRELVSNESYEKVTISDICSKAGVSRRSFYAHYTNKSDLLEQLFYLDIIKSLEDITSLLPTANMESAPQLLIETVFRKIIENQGFYRSLFGYSGNDGSVVRDISIVLLTKQFSQLNYKNLHLNNDSEETEYISYYFAAAAVALISKWVRENMILPPDKLANIYVQFTSAAMKALDSNITALKYV